MGSKIKDFLISMNLSILNSDNRWDVELSFNGPADQEVLQAWANRFKRLKALREFFGKENYPNVKAEFLNCLTNQNHSCTAEVNYIIAKK